MPPRTPSPSSATASRGTSWPRGSPDHPHAKKGTPMITDYGVKGLIDEAPAAPPESDKLATLAQRVDSALPAGSTELLDFIGMVPALREWTGGRNAKRPPA